MVEQNKKKTHIENALTETVKNRIGRPLLPLFSVQGDCGAETVNDFWLAVEMAMLSEEGAPTWWLNGPDLMDF